LVGLTRGREKRCEDNFFQQFDVLFIFALLSPKKEGVNFTNNLHAAFLYKSFGQSFFVLEVYVKFLLAKGNWRQCASKMLMKLTKGGRLNAQPVVLEWENIFLCRDIKFLEGVITSKEKKR
jgi:hypothetical protein